jgi:excisionase family DNA binding protein
MKDEMLTPKQVAAKLQVGLRTVQRWVQLGRLTPLRMSKGTVRFRESALLAAMEKYEFGAPPSRDPSLG